MSPRRLQLIIDGVQFHCAACESAEELEVRCSVGVTRFRAASLRAPLAERARAVLRYLAAIRDASEIPDRRTVRLALPAITAGTPGRS